MSVVNNYSRLIDEKLHILEKSFVAAVELTGAGIWNIDLKNNFLTADKKTLSIFAVSFSFSGSVDDLITNLSLEDKIKFKTSLNKTIKDFSPFYFYGHVIQEGYKKEVRAIGKILFNIEKIPTHLAGACVVTLPCQLPECHIRKIHGEIENLDVCKIQDL